jgi:glycosyltransferase involved in cell wall biosynthesis
MSGILVLFHCSANTGYAIAPLEQVFWDMALQVFKYPKFIHFSYKNFPGSETLASSLHYNNLLEFNKSTSHENELNKLSLYIKEHEIDTIFGFDLPIKRPFYKRARKAGVQKIIAYWGAPLGSLNHGLKLGLKRLEVALARNGPDHYIFESEAMRETGVNGRGIPRRNTSVVYLGVDVDRYHPDNRNRDYVREQLGVPADKNIVFYSGHMEERKGIRVLINAAMQLCNQEGRRDTHFVLCGNKGSEADPYKQMYAGTPAEGFITFCGYRNDLPLIMASSDLGVIPSTGWDSFTMSSVEMAASGLPLIVSDFQGLKETVEHGTTGFRFPPGDSAELASRIRTLVENQGMRNRMAEKARKRAVQGFSRDRQIKELTEIVSRVSGRSDNSTRNTTQDW